MAAPVISNAGKDKKNSGLIGKRIGQNFAYYAMMVPFFSLFFLFTVLPVVMAMILSFTSFDMVQMPVFNGVENYIHIILDDDVFIIAVKNTVIFAVLMGPISYALCILFAWLINELPKAARTFMTFIFYAPSISGAMYIVWTYIFSSDSNGFINNFLFRLGLSADPVLWLTDPKYMLGVVIIIQLWASLGTSFLAMIAGFQGVDRGLYEAGAIDGIKNRFQELIYITLPGMGPMLLFSAVMQIGASFAVNTALLVGLPSTDYAAHTIVSHINDYGTLRYEMGYACAVATLLFIAMMLFNRFVKKLISKFSD